MNIEQERAAFEAAYTGASALQLEDIELGRDPISGQYLYDQAHSTWEW